MTHANEHPTGSKGHHEFVKPSAARDPLAKTGYVEKEYSHQEYPKVVGQAHGKDVIVKDYEEEQSYLEKHAPKKAAAASDAEATE